MKTKRSKGFLIAAIIVGVLTLLSIAGFSFSLFVALTGYGIKIENAVYFKETDTIYTYVEDTTNIESITVTIVNTTNKEFIDYEIRLAKHIVNEYNNDNTYPTGSSSTKTITIKPKETIQVRFDKFNSTWTKEEIENEYLDLEYKFEDATVDHPDIYNTIYNGKDFNGRVETAYIVGSVISGVEMLTCIIAEVIILVKYFKPNKKLIKTMVKDKQ